MMSTNDVVVKCRPSRVDDITDQQIAYIPRLEEDQVECIMPYYIFEGSKVVKLNPKRYTIFKLKYLHFSNEMNSKKRKKYRSCKESLITLVEQKIIRPFMLFINGLFIPWECIDIVINNDDFYLVLDLERLNYYAYQVVLHYSSVQIFSIPDYMRYINGTRFFYDLPGQTVFAFTRDNLKYAGKYAGTNGKFAIVIPDDCKIPTKNLYVKSQKQSSIWMLYDNNKEKIKISDKNIFLFVGGRLHYGQPRSIKRFIISGDQLSYYYQGGGYNIPIDVNGNILIINNGLPVNEDISIIIFKNDNYTSDNFDNMMRISDESRIDAISKHCSGIDVPYFAISGPFDLPIIHKNSFDSHMEQSENFIMRYNPYLYNDMVKSYSTIDIQEFTGSDILKAAENNILSIGLDNSSMYEERILLLVNGILHANYALSVLDKNTISIPIESTISENDIVEIMRFKNVNNDEISLVINEDDGFIHQSSHIINSDMRIFCKTPSVSNYEYPETGFQQFEVEYTLEQNDDGLIKISLLDQFYYGKDLTIVSKNRFVYKNFIVQEECPNITIDMGNHFKFCIDTNRYMIFVNGRLLNRDQYTITIPCDATSENYQFLLYLNVYLKSADRIDVVYSSTDLEDFLIQDQIHYTGDIVVSNTEPMDYIFSKELYMIWLNGKKIPVSQLDDIKSNCIRLNTDQATTSNLRVIKYIKCDALNGISHDGFIWDEAIFNSGYSYDKINTIIGKKNVTLTNTEPNYSKYGAGLVVYISEDNRLILSDRKNIMRSDIDGNKAVLEDPSQVLQPNISNNDLYIEYEGSDS